MLRDESDASWERWGQQNPYYGVFTDDRFRRENISDDLKTEFFDTGRVHIERVLAKASSCFGVMAARRSALDFGCGVGRLVIPLSRNFDRVTGVDVSKSMLDVTESNCRERGISNVSLTLSNDSLTRITGKFDFIHSYLVFQHIPPARGEEIFGSLLDRLEDEGILAIHLPFIHKSSVSRKALHVLRRSFSPISVLANVVRGKRWNEPFIQMNTYHMDRILLLLSDRGIRDVFLELVEAGGFVSAFVFAKKPTHPINSIQGKHLWARELS